MKRVIALTLLGVLVAVPTYAQTRNAKEQEVLKASQVLDEASLIKKDRATMERLYADDYMYVHSNGTVANKAEAKGPWTTKAAMPEPAALMPASVVSGILYVFGLWPNLNLLAYDPVSDTWAKKTALPTRRDFAAGAVVNGILYVLGGRAGNADYSLRAFATVEAYDPVTNMWTTKAAMPTPRFGAAAGVVNGIVYVVGGFGAGGTRLSIVEAYNPATNSWTTRSPMPTPRLFAVGGVVNGLLYVAGGSGYQAFLTPVPKRTTLRSTP